MALSDISLTAGMRSNLVSLQNTVNLLSRTQERLSSGKKVNSALDNPTTYFEAQALTQRATDLSGIKDSISDAIQTVNAANEGVTAINSLIAAAKGLAQSARSADTAGRQSLAAQFDAIRTQIDYTAADSGYNGKDLLAATNNTLTVMFNEGGSSTLTVTGFNGTAAGLGIAAAANNWALDTNIDAAVNDLSAATTALQTNSATMAANLSVINIRQDFTTGMVNTLTTGSDNLTLADMNEESANMLMLQTRQALGITALSLSAQASQSVLKLF